MISKSSSTVLFCAVKYSSYEQHNAVNSEWRNGWMRVDGAGWWVVGGNQRMGAIRIKRRAKDSDSFQSAQSLRKDLPRAAPGLMVYISVG